MKKASVTDYARKYRGLFFWVSLIVMDFENSKVYSRLLKNVSVAFKPSQVSCLRLVVGVRMVLMLQQALFRPTRVNFFLSVWKYHRSRAFGEERRRQMLAPSMP
nr:hypothetical protein [Tanacetum cinerariifolium]